MRPTWDETVFAVARVMAKRSTCLRLQTASVICTPDHRIISTGYNGSLPGQEHCNDMVGPEPRGCEVVDNHCIRTVHSEANAILQAAKYGTPTQGCTMYSLHRTCVQCSKAIVQAGIIAVVFAESYMDGGIESASATEKLTLAGIVVRQI